MFDHVKRDWLSNIFRGDYPVLAGIVVVTLATLTYKWIQICS